MKQYNGEYGCTYCEDSGEPRPSCHLQRDWPYSTTCTKRTHECIFKNAKEVLTSCKPVCFLVVILGCCILRTINDLASARSVIFVLHGLHVFIFFSIRILVPIWNYYAIQVVGVKDASILAVYEYFKLPSGAVIDIKHCVFQGVVEKVLFHLWYEAKYRTEPYSIRKMVIVLKCVHC